MTACEACSQTLGERCYLIVESRYSPYGGSPAALGHGFVGYLCESCWRRAVSVPTTTPHRALGSETSTGLQMAGELGSNSARSNRECSVKQKGLTCATQ